MVTEYLCACKEVAMTLGIAYMWKRRKLRCHFFFRVSKPFQKMAAFSPCQTGSRSGNDSARGKQCIENRRSHFKETVFSHVKPEPKAL